MRQDMRPEQRQTLVMTPKLQQAIKLLQLSALELQQKLKQELVSNPMLEESEDAEEEAAEEVEPKSDDDDGEFQASEDTIDWDRYLKDGFEMGARASDETEETGEFFERVPVVKSTLEDYLLGQLRIVAESDDDIRIGEFIIGSIDSDGLLTISTSEIAELLSVDEERVDQVLAMIKSFDPPGIGASDTRECLLIQLERLGKADSLAATLVREHFEDMLHRRYPEIARKIRRPVKDVQSAADALAKLDPRPGARYSAEEPRYIVPDLIVDKVDDDYVVQLNDRNIPRLRVSRAYREILSSAGSRSKKEHEYVKDKLNSARWLIKTIDQRRRTMIKVMEAILDVQRDFFERGVDQLKPLTLQQIAERVDMHESTVSRVTNGKYVQTPRGVFDLKYFFSTGLKTDDGDRASSKKIKAMIQEYVDGEDQRRPLSDQDIADRLKKAGLVVARRTVAKYRDRLGILPARKRKRY
jgi:RNA polymerase sigma-54 factor